MDHILRRYTDEATARLPQPRWGVVQSVDAARAAVRVLIQPEGVLSGWLPVAMAAASSGWGVFVLPAAGDMVPVLPDAGSPAGMVVGSAHNDLRRPPTAPMALNAAASAPDAGTIVIKGQGGASVVLPSGGGIVLNGNVVVNGTLTVSGDIYDDSALHGALSTLRNAYDTHTHADAQGGNTGGPSVVLP